MKTPVALIAGLLCLSVTGNAIAQPDVINTAGQEEREEPRLTMGQWAKLPRTDRMIVILGAVEGLLLAVNAPEGKRAPVDSKCLVNDSPMGIEAKLDKFKSNYKNDAFFDVFLVVTNCLEAS